MHAIRNFKNVWHVVADDDDGQSAVAHAADQIQHHVAFFDAERSGRLVHDDDVPGERGAACHSDPLALPTGERFDRLGHAANADFQIRHVPRGFSQHRFLIDDFEQSQNSGAEDFAAHEQVFGNRHRGRDG